MGDMKKMVETVDDCCNEMQSNSNLPKADKDNYMKEMKSLMNIEKVDIVDEFSVEETTMAPEVILEKNKHNPNMSASINPKYYKNTGVDYVAARDIPRGEVLFVDTTYSRNCMPDADPDSENCIKTIVCNYCWTEAQNCIPCKVCFKLEYCSENCLTNSWTEYHQWECDMFRSKLFGQNLCLALRTLIKAAFSGVIFQITKNTKPCKSSEVKDPYWQIYSLHLDFASIRSRCTEMFVKCCEQAALMVEFLKNGDFFTRLMSTSSCRKDYSTVVNLIGGLLIRHTIQAYQRSINMHCPSLSVSIFEISFSSKNLQLHAFCPLVSGVKYSCESNTSLYFNGSSCIMKACKNIKAGDGIFRPGFNFSPMIPLLLRQAVLAQLDINCDCTACQDIANNGEILDTFWCMGCGEFTNLCIVPSPNMICRNCKRITPAKFMHCMVAYALARAVQREHFYFNSQDYEQVRAGINALKRFLNPNHEHLYSGYKSLLMINSTRENINNEFRAALHNFKTSAKNRNGRFDVYEYVTDLIVVCKACCNYLVLNEYKLPKREAIEIITYFSDVVDEAKEIAQFIFPPLLLLFSPLEYFILRFRVEHVSLQD